jgi:hypothetical protein
LDDFHAVMIQVLNDTLKRLCQTNKPSDERARECASLGVAAHFRVMAAFSVQSVKVFHVSPSLSCS